MISPYSRPPNFYVPTRTRQTLPLVFALLSIAKLIGLCYGPRNKTLLSEIRHTGFAPRATNSPLRSTRNSEPKRPRKSAIGESSTWRQNFYWEKMEVRIMSTISHGYGQTVFTL